MPIMCTNYDHAQLNFFVHVLPGIRTYVLFFFSVYILTCFTSNYF